MGRRIEEDFDGSSSLAENYRRLHDAAGNVLEEWNAGASRFVARYVVSPVTGEVILRDRDVDADGVFEERLLAQTASDGDVVALVDHTTGAVIERFYYVAKATLVDTNADLTVYPGNSTVQWRITGRGQWYDGDTGKNLALDTSRLLPSIIHSERWRTLAT